KLAYGAAAERNPQTVQPVSTPKAFATVQIVLRVPKSGTRMLGSSQPGRRYPHELTYHDIGNPHIDSGFVGLGQRSKSHAGSRILLQDDAVSELGKMRRRPLDQDG